MKRFAVVQVAKDGSLFVERVIEHDDTRGEDLQKIQCNRLVEIPDRPDIKPGWRFDKGWFSPPPTPESGVKHGS